MDEWRLRMTMIWALLVLSLLPFVVFDGGSRTLRTPCARWVGTVDFGTGRLDQDGDAGRPRFRLGVFRAEALVPSGAAC